MKAMVLAFALVLVVGNTVTTAQAKPTSGADKPPLCSEGIRLNSI
ncbi:MAG: hypothetical protein NT118_04515 [Lentisphaerae bacterium]|nr:hypothetical protein [Lentisphaerota bacterium]